MIVDITWVIPKHFETIKFESDLRPGPEALVIRVINLTNKIRTQL